MHNLRSRVNRLEQRMVADNLMVVHVYGGLDGEAQHPAHSSQQLDRLPGEALAVPGTRRCRS